MNPFKDLFQIIVTGVKQELFPRCMRFKSDVFQLLWRETLFGVGVSKETQRDNRLNVTRKDIIPFLAQQPRPCLFVVRVMLSLSIHCSHSLVRPSQTAGGRGFSKWLRQSHSLSLFSANLLGIYGETAVKARQYETLCQREIKFLPFLWDWILQQRVLTCSEGCITNRCWHVLELIVSASNTIAVLQRNLHTLDTIRSFSGKRTLDATFPQT